MSNNKGKASYAMGITLVAGLEGLGSDPKAISAHPAVTVVAGLFGKNPVNVALDVIREQAALSLTTQTDTGKTIASNGAAMSANGALESAAIGN
jgi:hypothetical protein